MQLEVKGLRWRLRGCRLRLGAEVEVEGVYSHSRKTSIHAAKLRCYD